MVINFLSDIVFLGLVVGQDAHNQQRPGLGTGLDIFLNCSGKNCGTAQVEAIEAIERDCEGMEVRWDRC